MSTFNTVLNPRYSSIRGEWEFTGRIKYVKYTNSVTIFFEIEYTDHFYIDHIFRASTKREIQVKNWISEKSFYTHEVPDEEIYDCNATP